MRGDDGLGPAALCLLEPALAGREITYLEYHQLLPELAEDLSQHKLAILIDASVEGRPGQVSISEVEPQPYLGRPMTHHVDPAALLGMARDLFGHAPRTFVVTVTGEDFDCRPELSPTVQAALPGLVEHVTRLVDQFAL